MLPFFFSFFFFFPPTSYDHIAMKSTTKEDESNSGDKGSVVHYRPNAAGKDREQKRIRSASFFYTKDVRARLEHDKKAWLDLAAGKSLKHIICDSKSAVAGSSAFFPFTPLKLLKVQLEQYTMVKQFSVLAHHGIFLSYYHPPENESSHKNNKKTTARDSRRERVIVVRKCPSKALVESMLPERAQQEHNAEDEYERLASGRVSSGFDSRPEETKIMEKLRNYGLDRDVLVAFAYVIPFYPSTAWGQSFPPPEQAEQFASYVKYTIASHTRVSTLVAFDKWTARYVLTGCNYDQMQYKPMPPDYASPVHKINIYPVSAKNRNIKSTGLKLVRLPHWCMWERGKDPELEALFRNGIERIQEGMIRSSNDNINAFDVMLRASVDKERFESLGNVPSSPPSQIPQPPKVKDENVPLTEASIEPATPLIRFTAVKDPAVVDAFFGKQHDEDARLQQALARAGCTKHTRPESIRFVSYDENVWKVPMSYSKYVRGLSKCTDCPMCTGRGFPCPFEASPDGDNNDPKCPWCCCDHGHRNVMGECSDGKGCKGWWIPPLYACDPPNVITVSYMCKQTIPDLPVVPTLEQLCVEEIRKQAGKLGVSYEASEYNRKVARTLPIHIVERWFRPCTDKSCNSALFWLSIGVCCETCFENKTDKTPFEKSIHFAIQNVRRISSTMQMLHIVDNK